MRRLSNILITAGPTREKLDNVRFISNLSTGTMGYELAKASRARGYAVTLISGPTNLAPPKGIRFIPVEDARQMEKAVRRNFKRADCLFMASAVCDWRPQRRVAGKIKRGGHKNISLRLVQNPDILMGLGKAKDGKILAGFALESRNFARNAALKLKKKNLDFIVANSTGKRTPFGAGRTDVTVIDRYGESERITNISKKGIALRLLKKAESLWEKGL